MLRNKIQKKLWVAKIWLTILAIVASVFLLLASIGYVADNLALTMTGLFGCLVFLIAIPRIIIVYLNAKTNYDIYKFYERYKTKKQKMYYHILEQHLNGELQTSLKKSLKNLKIIAEYKDNSVIIEVYTKRGKETSMLSFSKDNFSNGYTKINYPDNTNLNMLIKNYL